jgi:hypothetical protein
LAGLVDRRRGGDELRELGSGLTGWNFCLLIVVTAQRMSGHIGPSFGAPSVHPVEQPRLRRRAPALPEARCKEALELLPALGCNDQSKSQRLPIADIVVKHSSHAFRARL